jgi:phage-related tail protein
MDAALGHCDGGARVETPTAAPMVALAGAATGSQRPKALGYMAAAGTAVAADLGTATPTLPVMRRALVAVLLARIDQALVRSPSRLP